jgi:hypothetical protein
MRRAVHLAFFFLLAAAPAVWAGTLITEDVPTLGEAGLVFFGLSLLGGGAWLLRRRR